MARESVVTIARRRLLGLLYLVVVAALISLSVLIYQKTFTDVVLVSLKTDHTGNSLQKDSDVKERGIIVGTVRDVKVDSGPNGGCANDQATCVTVTLAIDPSRVGIIPNNVSAQVLPKTLFGEQYVALGLPAAPGPHIKAGDQIAQDRSKGALETEKVLGDLLPLLQAVKPAELNATLTAIAQALQGRGKELGQTLTGLDKYLKAFNPHTKALVDDLKKLGRVADEYNNTAPDTFATLNNLETNARTVIAKRAALGNLLTSATDTSNVVSSFLSDNEQHMITVTGTSDKIYSLLARYSPEFTCLLGGLNNLQQKANTIIRHNQIQLSVTTDTSNQGKYKPGEQPRLIGGYGPNCFGLPDNPQPMKNGKFQIPAKFRCINDGAALTEDPCGQDKASSDSSSSDGSQVENALVNSLLASSYSTTPENVPPIATMLAAPLYRGAQVNVK